MKAIDFNTMIVLLIFSSMGVLSAQNKVSLDNTEQFSITSKYVKGDKYIVQYNPHSPTEAYPELTEG
jgi:hypothetical protein